MFASVLRTCFCKFVEYLAPKDTQYIEKWLKSSSFLKHLNPSTYQDCDSRKDWISFSLTSCESYVKFGSNRDRDFRN